MNEEDIRLIKQIARETFYEILETEVYEGLFSLLEAFERGITAFKQTLAPKKGVATVKEETFTCLKFDPMKGQRIGEYEVAYKKQNLPENWSHAYNILKQNNTTINNRYHGIGYGHSYWLYGGKIYRQKLPQSKPNQQKKETLAGTRTFFY